MPRRKRWTEQDLGEIRESNRQQKNRRRSTGRPWNVRFEQPLPYRETNGIRWYLIETEAHRPYTKNGPRKQAECGIYVDMVEVK